MELHAVNNFLAGATMLASLVAALFFLRFWRKTHDRLFLMFAVALVLLGMNRIGVALSRGGDEAPNPAYYVIRLIAFLIIIIAIIDKNRGRRSA